MPYSLIARHGAMHYVTTFKTGLASIRKGDKLVLRTERGVELGEALSSPDAITSDQPDKSTSGEVLRKATQADLDQEAEIESEKIPEEFTCCRDKIEELELPMKLANVEHILGGEKIIFYYLAEGRVDFRQLVKDLAAKYRTRIEMRQIGVRDEARLLADYEHCGNQICCKMFMKNLEPVTMRMAKAQKTTLDPSKISGRCGRLMCCLRFEDETYAELRKRLPRRGTRVRIARGWGEVISTNILKQTVQLELEPGKHVTIKVDEIQERESGKSSKRSQNRGQNSASQTRPKERNDNPQRENDGKDRPKRGRNRPRRGGNRTRQRGNPSSNNSNERSPGQSENRSTSSQQKDTRKSKDSRENPPETTEKS